VKNVEVPRAFKNRFVIAIFAGLLLAMAFSENWHRWSRLDRAGFASGSEHG